MMTDLPRLALSVRQPWAWGIIMGKDIENRAWIGTNPGLKFRGRMALHASSGLTKEEYEEDAEFIAGVLGECPPARDLVRGAIIGSVTVVDVVRKSASPWFFGPIGLVLANPIACDPIPCKGQLGFFEWQPSGGTLSPPARWMLPPVEKPQKAPVTPVADLFGDH